VVSDRPSEPKDFWHRIDEGAARLNPGLSAIVVVLLTLVTGETGLRAVEAWQDALATSTAVRELTIDPAALTPSFLPDN
jgi:hypothetical protein